MTEWMEGRKDGSWDREQGGSRNRGNFVGGMFVVAFIPFQTGVGYWVVAVVD